MAGQQGSAAKTISTATAEGEKAASEFLDSIGVDLIEWPYNWQKPQEKNMTVG